MNAKFRPRLCVLLAAVMVVLFSLAGCAAPSAAADPTIPALSIPRQLNLSVVEVSNTESIGVNIPAIILDEAESAALAAGTISCEYFSEVNIEIGDESLPLADAVSAGSITFEDLQAAAQTDAKNGYCTQTFSSELGLSCFVYQYADFELSCINDIYELPDGRQQLIRSITICPLGKSAHGSASYYEYGEDGALYPLDRENWGITFTDIQATSKGITVCYTQSGGQQIGDIVVKGYRIVKQNMNEGPDFDGITAFSPTFTFESNSSSSFSLSWYELFGEIPAGDYILMLNAEDHYADSDLHPLMRNYADTQSYNIYFSVP